LEAQDTRCKDLNSWRHGEEEGGEEDSADGGYHSLSTGLSEGMRGDVSDGTDDGVFDVMIGQPSTYE